jgi:hypothetical protein
MNLIYSHYNLRIYAYKNVDRWFARAVIKHGSVWKCLCEVIASDREGCLKMLLEATSDLDPKLIKTFQFERDYLFKALIGATMCSTDMVKNTLERYKPNELR